MHDQVSRRRAGALILAFSGVTLVRPAIAATAAPIAETGDHQRLIPLAGGRNFRDLGGYRTIDGRSVKWGVLYRSGAMHGLTDADYRLLESRGIRVVCDFRDRREREAEPVRWPEPGAPRILFDDYDLDIRFMPPGDPAGWTAEQARAAMISSYPRLLAQFNGQYRRMFAELLAGHAPLAFNCSAGKDRTGIAAALLLTALGVPRRTVTEDYLLTNRYLDPASLTPRPGAPAAPNPANSLGRMSPAAGKAMLAADRAYIEAALAVVDQHRGGADGYLRDELGLDHADLDRLRSMYLANA